MSFVKKENALFCKNKEETSKKCEKKPAGLVSSGAAAWHRRCNEALSNLPRQLAPKKSDFLPQPHEHTSLSKYVHLI